MGERTSSRGAFPAGSHASIFGLSHRTSNCCSFHLPHCYKHLRSTSSKYWLKDQLMEGVNDQNSSCTRAAVAIKSAPLTRECGQIQILLEKGKYHILKTFRDVAVSGVVWSARTVLFFALCYVPFPACTRVCSKHKLVAKPHAACVFLLLSQSGQYESIFIYIVMSLRLL